MISCGTGSYLSEVFHRVTVPYGHRVEFLLIGTNVSAYQIAYGTMCPGLNIISCTTDVKAVRLFSFLLLRFVFQDY